jgi:hypothetical protein
MRDTHDAEVAVVDLLVVVILDLHDLVARTEGPAEAFNADLARWVQRVLQLDIERACPEAAAVHRTQHLDVPYRVEPEALRDPFLHDRQQLAHPLVGIGRIDEVEVTALHRGEVRHLALVDPVRIDDDPALGGLAEDLSQPHDGHSTRGNDLSQHLPRSDRRNTRQ